MESKISSTEVIRQRVVQWNKNFPLDYWWRKQYSIPFGSKEHFDTDLFKMRFEYEEWKLMKIAKLAKLKKKSIEEIILMIEERLMQNIAEEVSDDEFEELDLSEFNDK
jgi:hypothetical protein